MKNLVAELDLLQAKLNAIKELEHKSKLYKTKFIVEKEGTGDEDPEELEKRVEELKQELANRKLHHCIKQTSRQVKSFKQMEPLKLKKRIKNADEQKKKALEAELEFVKNIVVEEWAEYVAKAQLSKYFGGLLGFEKREISATESNVYGRLCGSAALKEAIGAAVTAISAYYTPQTPFKSQEEDKGKKGAALKEPKSKEAKKAKGEEAKGEDAKGEEAKPKEVKPKETKPKETKPKETKAKKENKGKKADASHELEDDFMALPDVSMDSDGDMEMEAEPLMDDFFVGADGSSLPQLTTGYISGSESEGEIEEADALKPERKNRRGQRARRAIWEKKFGGGAKHVVKIKQEERQKMEERERKRAFKVQKERQRQERQKQLEAKPLHPSWAAKQEQIKQLAAKPAGKKIVFD